MTLSGSMIITPGIENVFLNFRLKAVESLCAFFKRDCKKEKVGEGYEFIDKDKQTLLSYSWVHCKKPLSGEGGISLRKCIPITKNIMKIC